LAKCIFCFEREIFSDFLHVYLVIKNKMTYSERMQRFIKRKQEWYELWLNQFEWRKRKEIIESALKQKCDDRKINDILEHFWYDKLTIDEVVEYYWFYMWTDIRKNRAYRYSRADNLSRNQIILLADNLMKKSPDFINDVLKFKWLEPMKTIKITKEYELKQVKEMEIWDKFEVELKEPYGIQTAHVVNVDKLWWIVAQTFRKTPLYLKEGYVIRELWTENYKLLSDDEVKEIDWKE
jgi:hypothetical protein